MFKAKYITVMLNCVRYTLMQYKNSNGEINPAGLDLHDGEAVLEKICVMLEHSRCLNSVNQLMLIEELNIRIHDWEDFKRMFPFDSDVADKRITVLRSLKHTLSYRD